MEKPLILALDIGTSSVRAALYDGNGTAVPRAFEKNEYSFAVTIDGGSELDADLGLAKVVEAIDAVLEKSKRVKTEIAFAAPCSFWHSLVGIDAKGKATTKVLGWADTRSGAYSEVLKKRFCETETHNRTGARFHSSFWPAKLLWLRRTRPGIFARTERWLSFADYVALKLFGEAVTSVSMASGTGIFDIRQCAWDGPLLKFLKVKQTDLPVITERDLSTFSLSRTFAKRWPRLAGTRWFPAIADGAADNIGAGCVTSSKAALMIGTSGAMRVAYAGEPPKKIPPGLWCYRIDRKRVIIGGALSDGGGLYRWLTANLKLPKGAVDQMRQRGAAAHGLTFLPFFFGERGTGYNENAKGAILGLTASHDAVDILQAAMESIAYRFAEINDQLNRVVKIKEIVASGGALRESPLWTQIIADMLGRHLTLNNAPESSMRGAVLLALESTGKIESINKSLPPAVSLLAYHPRCHAIYKSARDDHRKHYKARVEQNS